MGCAASTAASAAAPIKPAEANGLPEAAADNSETPVKMPTFFNTSATSNKPGVRWGDGNDLGAREGTEADALQPDGLLGGPSLGSKSLRRSTSVYSDFQVVGPDAGSKTGSEILEISGGVRETNMLRTGSVKNTGVFVNQYAVVKNLGAGSFGKVKLAMDTRTGELVAIKVVARANKQRRQMMMKRAMSNMMVGDDPDALFAKEISVMKKLYHPNVVQLIEVIDDPSENKLMLVMEYVDGGVLDCSHAMDEEQARKLFQDAAKGLHYLHKSGIVHGDVKPDNMLISEEEGVVKLTDFGSSSMFERGDTMSKTTGTPAFMCPEQCAAKPYHGREADCWALAVCLWNMAFGQMPFAGSTIVALYDAIRDQDPVIPDEPQISPELQDLLLRSLKKDPEERLTLEGMMNHSWTTNHGQLDLLGEGPGPDTFLLAEIAKQAQLKKAADMLHDFPRRSFKQGEYLFMAGLEANEMYFIEEGEVEIVLREQDRLAMLMDHMENEEATREALSDSDESYESEESEEYDDFEMPNEEEDGIVAPGDNKTKPAWAVEKFSNSTYDMVKNVSGSLHRNMSRRATNAGEELLGRKQAGQFVGSVGPSNRSEVIMHATTARASGLVKAVVITREAADTYIAENPKTSDLLRNAVNRRETEDKVFGVMARLSTLHQKIQQKEKG